jgi:hydrogenase nickel incorporation protein HypB
MMCKDCGCEEGNKRIYNRHHDHHKHDHDHGHDHHHDHDHGHDHHHDHDHDHDHHHNHDHNHEYDYEQEHEFAEDSGVHFHYHFHGPVSNFVVHNHFGVGKPVAEGCFASEEPEKPEVPEGESRKIEIGRKVLAQNDELAGQNRAFFQAHGIKVLNMISSPGSGKTTLLEKTLTALAGEIRIFLITGDQQTDIDAGRLKGKGAFVHQINTHSSCHLDAAMIDRLKADIHDYKPQLLLIENVGNLVCPAAFDLGEEIRVALLSAAEGEEKPLKYPVLFHDADLVLLTKLDLAAHLDWDLGLCERNVRQINPNCPIIKLSAKAENGLSDWYDYLRKLVV